MIEALIKRLFHMGFSLFIVGDMALLIFLKKNLTVPVEIHVSGEMSESNQIMNDEMRSLGAKRNISETIPFPLRRSAAMRWKVAKRG